MPPTPHQFLHLKLEELHQHSLNELALAESQPYYTVLRIYSRIKMTCGVLDTLVHLQQLHLSPGLQQAYILFRKHSWQEISRIDAPESSLLSISQTLAISSKISGQLCNTLNLLNLLNRIQMSPRRPTGKTPPPKICYLKNFSTFPCYSQLTSSKKDINVQAIIPVNEKIAHNS